MYRNNFRSPQMQPRNNAGMRNGSCGGRRNNGAEDCRCAMPVEPSCGGAGTQADDCSCECPCAQRPSVPECGREAVSERIIVIEPERGCDRPEEAENGCKPSKRDSVSGMLLAMAYVPWQDYKDIYPEEESWCRGTIFAQLDLEFACRRCN